MKKTSVAMLLLLSTSFHLQAAVPDGKTEPPFAIDNEVICLKEIQKQMTPFLKQFEQETVLSTNTMLNLVYRTRIL